MIEKMWDLYVELLYANILTLLVVERLYLILNTSAARYASPEGCLTK